MINIAVYLVSVSMLSLMRTFAYGMQAKIFGVSTEDAARISLNYIAAYKLLIPGVLRYTLGRLEANVVAQPAPRRPAGRPESKL